MTKRQSELVQAACDDEEERVLRALADGAAVDERGVTGLTALTHARSPTIVKALLAAGSRWNVRDPDGNAALHYLYGDNIDKGELLIARGADLYVENQRGESALSRVRPARISAQARYLLHCQDRAGIVIPARGTAFSRALSNPAAEAEFLREVDRCGIGTRWWVSLFDAIELGKPRLLDQLLQEGASSAIRNVSGGSPLIRVVNHRRGTLAMLDTLISHGVDPSLRDNSGLTAFDWAVRLGRHDLGERLGDAIPPRLLDAYERGIYEIQIGRRGIRSVCLFPGTDHPLCMGIEHPRDPLGWRCTYTDALQLSGEQDARAFLAGIGADWFVPYLEQLANGIPCKIAALEEACLKATGSPLLMSPFGPG